MINKICPVCKEVRPSDMFTKDGSKCLKCAVDGKELKRVARYLYAPEDEYLYDRETERSLEFGIFRDALKNMDVWTDCVQEMYHDLINCIIDYNDVDYRGDD